MTPQGGNGRERSKRQERALRILDAAAALIERWGYQKTTLDDISKQSGVPRATMYLHWRTREDLLRALIQRERIAMGEELRERILADPEGATISGGLKHTALLIMQRPLLRALIMRDIEMLDKMAHEGVNGESRVKRMAGFQFYLEFLRDHGLVRSDMDVKAQVYAYSAICLGFFLAQSFLPEGYQLPDEEIAELLALSVERVLGSMDPVAPEELEAATTTFIHYLDSSLAEAKERFQQELE
ncbi:TetR family transcriptional regulator [Thermosporothrix hazakensis]|uniref:TetR family transcriptional regulator n=1 Tax=Thermosporothrix hazakensis TaxID=644383 RepID=A0A326U7X8_THEHA|nr:TetR/AcrR family transcriptional regulator [Thermosporothrix hazakensis]PZW31224.1 TetR family transcriptional regulator [Thermosporothrix hazakensis]GCE50868.1 TetR family transcriptional regulator [Thermosporothrix hazakensis]